MKSFLNILFFLLGFFCTMNAIMINFGVTSIAIYNIIILFILLLKLLKIMTCDMRAYIYNYKYPWYLLFISIILSLLSGYQVLNNEWFNNSLLLSVKFMILIFPIIILFDDYKIIEYRKAFFKGLLYSAVFQLLWGGMQLIFWSFNNILINQLIFRDSLGVGPKEVDWNNLMGGIIMRMTGLSWEPANFALTLLVGFILTKSKFLASIFILGIIFSTSKTGYLVLLFILLMKFIDSILNQKDFVRLMKTKKNLCLLGIFFCVLMCTYCVKTDLINSFFKMFMLLSSFLWEAIFSDNNLSANIHKAYYLELPNLWMKSDLIQIFFGYGYFSAGYPYQYIVNILSPEFIWNPESDFITIFTGNGVFGGLVYYFLLVKTYIFNKHDEKKYLVLVFSIAGISYLYLRGTWIVLVLIFLYIDEKRLNK